MKKLLVLAVTIFFGSAMSSGFAWSQNSSEPVAGFGDVYNGAASLDPKLNQFVTEDEVVMKDGYNIPTYKNLSKLYWALAMFDLSDNSAIDGFLMINQCDLFKKYYNNDFELEGLREATRQSIQTSISTYPVKYEIMIPIGLDRYNIGTEKFAVDLASQFIGARRLEIMANSPLGEACPGIISKDGPDQRYPRNFILSLARPLTVTDVPVSPDVAQFYIEQMDKEFAKHSSRKAISKYGRLAYLRITVTLYQFKTYNESESGLGKMAEIYGTLDSFEMYGDRDKTLLMFNQDMAKARAAKKSKTEDVNIPEGQFIESQGVDSGGNVIMMSSDSNVVNKASPETGLNEGYSFDVPSAAPPVVVPQATKAPVPAPQPAPASAPH